MSISHSTGRIPALAAALAYAAAGIPVFPARPGGKAPLTAHGFQDATTDPAVIRAWWARWPAANLAIATGAPGPDVLDVDVRPDGAGWPAFNMLQRAGLLGGIRVLIRTPSGGAHAWFTGTSQRCGSLPALHLDLKAAGGYVLAPPSVVQGRAYELLQRRDGTAALDWPACRALLAPPPAGPARPAGPVTLAGLAAWLERQPHGTHNNRLFWAACRAAEAGLDPWPLADAAVRAGHGETRARRTISSAIRTVTT